MLSIQFEIKYATRAGREAPETGVPSTRQKRCLQSMSVAEKGASP